MRLKSRVTTQAHCTSWPKTNTTPDRNGVDGFVRSATGQRPSGALIAQNQTKQALLELERTWA